MEAETRKSQEVCSNEQPEKKSEPAESKPESESAKPESKQSE